MRGEGVKSVVSTLPSALSCFVFFVCLFPAKYLPLPLLAPLSVPLLQSTMIHRRLSTLIILAAIAVAYIPGVCNGFSLGRSSATQNAHYYTSKSTTSTSLKVLPESITGPEGAQSYFYLWFFGGSGGAGVALRQFPQQIDKFNSLRSMVSSCKIILQHKYSLSNSYQF